MNKRQKLVQEQFLNDEEAVIKRLKDIYNQSYKDITGKIANLDSSISELQKALADVGEDEIGGLAAEFFRGNRHITPDEAKETLQSMLQSKVYQRNYQKSLQKQVDDILGNMLVDEYKTVSEYLNKCYEDGFIGTMYDLQGQGIPLAFPLDQEAMVRAVQLDSKISQGLYKRLGEDITLLKAKITAQVSRGISTGMSYHQVAQHLAGETNIGFNNAVRIARTEGHRIQCQAGMDACYKAKEKGADVLKRWDATLDARTRDSHAKVDGQIRELDEKFSNGLMYPGDPSGGAAEVVNCRCALTQKARWALERPRYRLDNETGEIIQCNSYAEFKEKYLSATDRLDKVNINKVATATDKEQFARYKNVLKDVAPQSLDDFYKLKHNNPEGWKVLKNQYRTVNQYKVDSGKLTPREILDLDYKVISEKRTKFGGDFKLGGNIAGAYIDGKKDDLFIAHSMVNTLADATKSKYTGGSTLVRLLDKRQFKYIDVLDGKGELRDYAYKDTEAKLFEHLALLYEKKPFKSVTLLSERGMCDSCLGVMAQFKDKYNVTVNAVSNNKVTGNVWGKRWKRNFF